MDAKMAFNLKIIPLNDKGIPAGLPFLAMFNPDSFFIKEDVKWQQFCAAGNEGGPLIYSATRPRTFTIEFMLDGTGVNTGGVKIPVTAQVLLFRTATTKIIGAIHSPPSLLLQYGTFICNCKLNSSTITYNMFDSFGLPIRAKISASFTEYTSSAFSAIVSMFSSPDLTHRVTVAQGDILPLMTYEVYDDQNYYLQVAKVNKLKNFRKLKAGTTLVFPPIADK
jgi:hypothetical protein